MSTWSPQQSAAFKAEAAGLFIEGLANSAKARRGFRRLLGIAGQLGFAVNVGGIRLNREGLQQQEVQQQQTTGERGSEEADTHGNEAEGEARDASVTKQRKPRKKSEAKRQKDRDRLEAKWQKKREMQQTASAPAPRQEAPETPQAMETAGSETPQLSEWVTHELEVHELRRRVESELARVANLTHTDVRTLQAGAAAAEGALMREGRAQGRVILAKELLRRRLEWLAAYEHDTAKRIEEAMRKGRGYARGSRGGAAHRRANGGP